MTRRTFTTLCLTCLLLVASFSVGVAGTPNASSGFLAETDASSPSLVDGTSAVRPDAIDARARVVGESPSGEFRQVADSDISFTTSNATTGTTYEYELPESATARNFEIDVTGTVSTETDTESGSLRSSGSPRINVAGNADPTGAELTLTGQAETVRSAYRDGDNNFVGLYGATLAETEHGHDNPPDVIDAIRVYQAISAGTGGDVDVYIVEESPDGEYREGTKVKENWDIPATTGYKTIDIDDYTVGSSSEITIEFVTRNATSQNGNAKTRATFQNDGGRFSQSGTVIDAVGDFILVGAPPSDVSASAANTSNASFGSLPDGNSKTRPLPVSTTDESISISWDGAGSLQWSLTYTERTVSENVTVEVNGNPTRYPGILADGSTASLPTDTTWLRSGENRVTVAVGNDSLTADAPTPSVELDYRHDVRLPSTATPEPDDDGDDGDVGDTGDDGDDSDDSDDVNDSGDSDDSDDGDSSRSGGGGGGGGAAAVAPSTETSTPTPIPTTTATAIPEAAADTTPSRFDDTVIVDVSFERETIRPSEDAVVLVTIRNPQSTTDTHPVELELFGQVVNAREVTVPANGETTVRFVHTIVEPGTYTARADDRTATIRVLAPGETLTPTQSTTSTTFPGLGAGVAFVSFLAVVVGAALLARRD